MYLFEGAPDTIFSTHKDRYKVNPGCGSSDSGDSDSDGLVNMEAEVESDSSGTEDETMEMERQPGVVNKVMNLPEKVGEVIAGLQFLLVAKVIRTYIRKQQLIPQVTASGCLVDKSNGVIYCTAVASILSLAAEHKKPISVSFLCRNGMLTSSILCNQIQELISH